MKYILLIFCICIFLSSCHQNDEDTVLVDDNVKIPIKACVEANTKVLGNSVDPVILCKCIIPKLYTDFKNDPEKLKIINESGWFDISTENQDVIATYYQDCITQSATNDSTSKLTITPRMAERLKTRMQQEMVGTDIEKTNDIDKYCDCVIQGFQTDFTANEVMKPNFNETAKYQILVDKCLESSKKY